MHPKTLQVNVLRNNRLFPSEQAEKAQQTVIYCMKEEDDSNHRYLKCVQYGCWFSTNNVILQYIFKKLFNPNHLKILHCSMIKS